MVIADELASQVDGLPFTEPVAFVYNPLVYAREAHAQYCRRYGAGKKQILWLGMNPGPFGMAQCGVPFGEISAVRDWMGICSPVDRPKREHPKRPVQGFDCPRSEVSGRRLWGYVQERWGRAADFFASSFVYNYCPLLFVHESGKNLTPDKLPAAEREPLFAACDTALRASVRALGVERVIGVGAFAEIQAKRALAGFDLEFGRVLHPSPASPAANRGWAQAAQKALDAQGLYQDIAPLQAP